MTSGIFLGIDTSNYTTSAAVYNPQSSTICQKRQILPVKSGELGLRQSDALFYHIRQLPEILQGVLQHNTMPVTAICVSDRPRDLPDSYMPCFLAGKTAAQTAASVAGIPCYTVSHQAGHIAAALFSAGRLDLLRQSFLAFHVSGGTTEVLRVTPHHEKILSAEILAATKDISAGQLIDRIGVAMGLPFPAGPHLEQIAMGGQPQKTKRPIIDSKGGCNLSGMENLIKKMLADGVSPADAALYTLNYLADVLSTLTDYAIKQTGNLPIVYSGGVLANRQIRTVLAKRPNTFFAQPEFSSDNAAGIAVLGWLLYKAKEECPE